MTLGAISNATSAIITARNALTSILQMGFEECAGRRIQRIWGCYFILFEIPVAA
jgi:hypothetical protein